MMRIRSLATVVLTALVLAVVYPASPARSQGEATDSAYQIGPRDRLQIRVDELPDVSGDYEVGEDGTIRLPRVGTMRVRDLTEPQLADKIRVDLQSAGLRQATVAVQVTEYRSKPVSVLGAVAQPGNVVVRGAMPLFDVLMSVGGVAERYGKNLRVRRRAANGLSDQLDVPVAALLRGDPLANIPIFPGDLINLPRAAELSYSFLGEVEGAGQQTFLSTEGVTLLTAIARVGGLSDTASPKVRILRLRPDGSRQEIEAHIERILELKDPDIPLEDGDIIVVKESFF